MDSQLTEATHALAERTLMEPWMFAVQVQAQLASFCFGTASALLRHSPVLGAELENRGSQPDAEPKASNSEWRQQVDPTAVILKAKGNRLTDEGNEGRRTEGNTHSGSSDKHPRTSQSTGHNDKSQSRISNFASTRSRQDRERKRRKVGSHTGIAAPTVIDGLRHRNYSAKLAAVSAMATNRKLRTEETLPLVERIVDNKTITKQDPELRKAALKVRNQTRREIAKESPEAIERKPATHASARHHGRGASRH